MSPYTTRRTPRRPGRGFTLVEVMLALGIMALLMGGAIDLFLAATRTTAKTQAALYANMDAANALQYVIGEVQECQAFALPTSSTAGVGESLGTMPFPTLPSGMTLAQLSTTFNGETINTALALKSPPKLQPGDVGYPTGPSQVTVNGANGSALPNSAAGFQPYNTGAESYTLGNAPASDKFLLVYRGDANTTANPSAGTYLWQYDLNAQTYTALCKTVATAPDAVQFVRHVDAGGIPEPKQVEIRIVSSYYSPGQGQQTSEATDGTTTSALTGKCVFLRDNLATATPHSSTRTSNNPFQAN